MAASPSGVARVVFVKPDGGDLPSAPPPKLVAFVFGIAGARKAVEEQKGFYGDRSVTLCYKSPFDDDELVALETVSDWETAVQLTKLGLARRPLVPAAPCSGLAQARALTSSFHRLARDAAAAAGGGGDGDGAAAAAATARLEALRPGYQSASQLTTSRHRTCRYVFSRLTALGLRPGRGQPPLPLLEVGAVNTDLLACPWLATRAVDLRSVHPRIEQADFLRLPASGQYGAVVCCLVLNCVADPRDRGTMLRLLRAHLRPGGVAFLVLPRRCVEEGRGGGGGGGGGGRSGGNGGRMTASSLADALRCVGLVVEHERCSPRLAFVCARAAAPVPGLARRFPHAGAPPPGDFYVSLS